MSDTKKDKKSEQVNQDQVPNGTDVISATESAEEAAKKIIAEAEERAAKIVAAAEETAKEKAESVTEDETPVAKTRPGEELVDFTAPLLPGQERQDIVVGVNGEIIRIQRGETVRIKRKFVGAINDAARQQVEAHKASGRAQKIEKMYDL